jgi:hypothetical protein
MRCENSRLVDLEQPRDESGVRREWRPLRYHASGRSSHAVRFRHISPSLTASRSVAASPSMMRRTHVLEWCVVFHYSDGATRL